MSRFRLMNILLMIQLVTIGLVARDENAAKPYDFSPKYFYISVATPPSVITNPADSIRQTAARLNASVNPSELSTQAQFEWGLTNALGNTTPLRDIGSGSTFISFSESITGLTPNTTYHFRVSASNADGINTGIIRTFKTLPNPPTGTTLSPSSIGLTSATLRGLTNPNGASTNGWFEWGPDTTYGNTTTSQSLGSGTTNTLFSQEISGLTSNNRYHYRAVVQNAGGTTPALDKSFTTLASSSEYLPNINTIVLYHMNEPDGSFVQDYSGNDLHGTANGSPITAGKYGRGRTFNLSTDYIESADDSLLDFQSQSFTLEAWVTPFIEPGGDLMVIGKGNPTNSNEAYTFTIRSSHQLEFRLNSTGSSGGAYIVLSIDSLLSDATFHHIAAVVDFTLSEVRLYHNTIQINSTATGTFPSSLFNSNAPLRIGLPSSSIINKSSSSAFHCIIDEVQISKGADFGTLTVPITVAKNWNIISLPVTVTNGLKTSIFPTANSSAFTFTEIGYEQRDTLKNGLGYWLKFNSDQTIPVAGAERLVDTFSVMEGWNIIGSITNPVATNTIISTPPNNITSQFFAYSNGYSPVDTIRPGKGYWVKVDTSGTLRLSTSSAQPNSPPISSENLLEQFNSITINNADGNSQILYFGVSENNVDIRKYDLPPLPVSEAFDVRFKSQRMIEILKSDGLEEYDIMIQSPSYPLTLRWHIQNSDWRYTIKTRPGMLYNLSGTGTTQINTLPMDKLTLRVENGIGESLPEKFALQQNYPNPFNPITIINYQLPRLTDGQAIDNYVTLKVFNMLGEEIATLVDEIQEAGYRSVEFSAHNLPSGIYVYRLTAGSFSETRTMLLLK